MYIGLINSAEAISSKVITRSRFGFGQLEIDDTATKLVLRPRQTQGPIPVILITVAVDHENVEVLT